MPLSLGERVTFIIRNQWTDPYMLIMQRHVAVCRVDVDALGNPQYYVRHTSGVTGPSLRDYGPYGDGDLLDGWV